MPSLAILGASAAYGVYETHQANQSTPRTSPRAQIASAAIGAGANIYGTYAQQQANDQAAGANRSAVKQALGYQNKVRQEDRVLEERDRADFLERQAYDRAQTAARQQRLQPYQGMGLAAMAQLREPIYGQGRGSGTLADLMRGRG